MLLAGMVLMGGCASTTVPIADSTALCKAWREIQVCPQDELTDETSQRILKNNAGRESYSCPRERVKQSCPRVKTGAVS